MPTATYELISTSTTSGTVSSITISSIPSTYTDLVLVTSGTITSAGQLIYRMNNDATGGNYTTTNWYQSNDTVANNTSSGLPGAYIGSYSVSGRAQDTLHIANYKNTSTWKSFYIHGGAGTTSPDFITSGGIWKSTAAISSIVILVNGANFTTNYKISLYGILAGS